MDTPIRPLEFEAHPTFRDVPHKCGDCAFHDAQTGNCDRGLFETKGIDQYECTNVNVYWTVVKDDTTRG